MPKTIQQFIDEFAKIKKNIDEALKENVIINTQAKNLFTKNKLQIPNDTVVEKLLTGIFDPTPQQLGVWNKLNPSARRNFKPEDLSMFERQDFGAPDDYIYHGDVQGWWKRMYDEKNFYDVRPKGFSSNIYDKKWGIRDYGKGGFGNVRERNTYVAGALYADNNIGNLSSPFIDVEKTPDVEYGIGNRNETHNVDAYNILKSGSKNAEILQSLAYHPPVIVYLNDTKEVQNLQKKYSKNSKLLTDLTRQRRELEIEKNFLQPEKLELIEQYRKLSGAIDNLSLKVTGLEQNQKAQKNLTDTFFKGSGKGMSMRDELMSQSESLQQDISNLNKSFETEKKWNKKAISNINTKFQGLNKNFADLKSLYSVNESKLKENSNLIEGNISKLEKQQVLLNSSISGIQKEMNENSKNYALEKEKVFGEIEELRKKGDEFIPAINDLNTRLANLTKVHDLAKNNLLGKMKTLEEFNKTKFIEIENKNEDFKNRYNKNTEQLQRDLGFVRAGIDARDRDIEHLADEAVQAREAFGRLEKQNNVKFKTLFDYNTYTNRQIKKQNTNKLTTLGNIRKAAQPDLLKKAFAGFVRGRFFDAQPILY